MKAVTKSLSLIKAPSLPETAAGADGVLARLPSKLGGLPRAAAGAHEISYGNSTRITAAPLSEAAGSGMSMATFFHTFMTSGQFQVEAQSRSGATLLWFVADSTDPAGQAVGSLANVHGKWLYGLEAPDRQHLQQLVTAFQSALPSH